MFLKSAFTDSGVQLIWKYWRGKQERKWGAIQIDGGFHTLIFWGKPTHPLRLTASLDLTGLLRLQGQWFLLC